MFSPSSLEIEFDRNPAIYYGSELLSGLVHLTTNDAQLQNRQLSIELNGEATYEYIERRHDNKDRREIKTITFLFKTVRLDQPFNGQEQSSVSNGRTSWIFEIELPAHAPPTFEIQRRLHTNHPVVQYSVTARLQRAVLDSTQTKKIIFCPPVLFKPATTTILSAVR